MNAKQRLDGWRKDLLTLDVNCRDMVSLVEKFAREWGCTYTISDPFPGGSPTCVIYYMGTGVSHSAANVKFAIHGALKEAVEMIKTSPAARVRHEVVNIGVLVEHGNDLSGFVHKVKEALGPYVSGFKIDYAGIQYGTDGYED